MAEGPLLDICFFRGKFARAPGKNNNSPISIKFFLERKDRMDYTPGVMFAQNTILWRQIPGHFTPYDSMIATLLDT
jgi:hypothetical protein